MAESIDTAVIDTAASRAADIVSGYFREPIRTLESMTDPIAAALAVPVGRKALTAGKLDGLIAPFGARLLDMPEVPVYGAGFIAAHDLLSDARSHLSWWQGTDRRQLVLAAQSVNKERIDYSELEWFRVPLASGGAHVAGPYVDYLCSDEYTITIAAPVSVDGVFAGVAAFDILIEDAERELMALFDELDVDVTIVNGVGRVVSSTDPRRATGDFIRDGDVPGAVRRPCADIALEVLVAGRE